MIEKPESFLSESGAGAKRGQNRDSLFLKATLRFASTQDEGEVRIRNLSAGGLMAEAAVQVPRGEKVELKLRNIGWIRGTVAWVAEGRIGIAFEHPIDPKLARKPVGTAQTDLPHYLNKLNKSQEKNRRNMRWV